LDSADSGGFRWSEIWQEGLLIFSFRYILSPAEFGQSGIETGMVRGLAKRNGTGIRLFVWHIAKQAIVAKQSIVCLAFTILIFPLTTTTSLRHRRQPSPPPPIVATAATS
jgi:hypothetical protein